MTTCALVGALDFNTKHFLAQRFDSVVAVDRGYARLMAIGIQPNAVVGDFDSLGYVPKAAHVEVFPTEKDESDMELACQMAKTQATTLLLYGCLAGRIDHTIANIQLISGLSAQGFQAFGIGDGFALTVLTGTGKRSARLVFDAIPLSVLNGAYRNFISVFAHGGTAHGVTENGLRYAFHHEEVPDTVSRGLSNEFIGSPATIEVEKGSVLTTFPLEAWDYLRLSAE